MSRHHFKFKFEQKERDRLTQEEVEMIEDADLSHDETSERMRDIFLFTCYTGVRFEDGQSLTTKNLVKDQENHSIVFKMGKTKEQVNVSKSIFNI